jgi:nucleotide-binding universal stress UspA family protein
MSAATAFRRVVVGIDGRPAARDAVILARRLADPGAAVTLVHVDGERSFRHHAPEMAAEVVAAADLLSGDFDVATRVVAAASAARGLAEVAAELEADLLVIGASHRGGARPAPGRCAHRLLQIAPCAVAIAPFGSRDAEPLHHVGVAYDGSAEAAAAVRAGFALAARDGAAVTLYSVIPPSVPVDVHALGRDPEHEARERRDRATAELEAAADTAPAGVNPRTVVLVGDAAWIIVDTAAGIADLLVCGSRGTGPLHRTLIGSVADGILRRAGQPVIVLPRTGVRAPVVS